MGRTYKVGPAGSLGARYGTVARKRYAAIVSELRAPHECPQCHIEAVKRLSVGIWLCGRCGYKFAGGAYSPTTKLGEIAERAARTGAAVSLVAGLKVEQAQPAEVKAKAKAPTRRRRKKAEPEKGKEKEEQGTPEDKSA